LTEDSTRHLRKTAAFSEAPGHAVLTSGVLVSSCPRVHLAFPPVRCRLHVPFHFCPRALVGDDLLVGVTCLVRADTLALSPPSLVLHRLTGLVSPQHVLEADRISRIVYYALIYTHSCHRSMRLITACFTTPLPPSVQTQQAMARRRHVLHRTRLWVSLYEICAWVLVYSRLTFAERAVDEGSFRTRDTRCTSRCCSCCARPSHLASRGTMDVLERLERVVDVGTGSFLLACGHLKELHASLQLDVPCFPRLAHATCSPFAVWYHRYPPFSLTACVLVVLFHSTCRYCVFVLFVDMHWAILRLRCSTAVVITYNI